MNVLFVVWELDPFFKIGGLGDVARSLPGALKTLGVDIRIMLPYYKVVKMGRNKKVKKATCFVDYAGKKEAVEIWEVIHPHTGTPAYFFKNKKYLDTVVSMATWGFFDKAVVTVLKNNILDWNPDILHLNDLHCGLIPLLAKLEKLPVKTVLTVHNLAYQGHSSLDIINRLGIDPQWCKTILWEIKTRKINFLLEGIVHADIITTVSPTYAKEILSEEFGAGLNDILKGMEGRIFGILNGIDIQWRNNMHRASVKYPYALTERRIENVKYYHWKEGKRLNKKLLQKKLGLRVTPNIPLISFIGRMDAGQKGIDILHKMLRRIDQNAYEFVILGTGDKHWEERYQWLSTFYPKNISCNFRFDEALAHQIYAASDFMIIPSRYEPCGLIQMIAMLFGTIPIAYKTGGLKDSIKDEYNGFLFSSYSSEALEEKIKKAVALWRTDRIKYEEMVERALTADFSWDKSAGEYLRLYEKLKEAN